MSAMRIDSSRVNIAIAFFLTLFIAAPQAMAAQPCAVSPASGGVAVMPNVLVILDNSGSMLGAAFPSAYDNSKTYIGFFDPIKKYSYSAANKYFVEDASGTWSGNFLNWACLTRWDAAIYVLTGQNYKDVSSVRTLVTNADPRYQKSATFIYPNRFYDDIADVTPYPSGTTRGYRPVPYYYADDYSTGAGSINEDTNKKLWPYLEVCEGTYNNVDGVPCGTCSGTKEFFYLRLKVESTDPLYQPKGILHDLEEKVRLGLMHFNRDDGTNAQGGFIKQYVKKLTSAHLANVVSSLRLTLAEQDSDTYFPSGTYLFHTWTPVAETLYEATRYFQQKSPYYSSSDYKLATSATADPTRDPMYNEDYSQTLFCAKNYIILLTDGEPTDDRTIPWTDDASPARKVRDADNDGCDGTQATADYCPCNNSGCGYTCNCDDTTFRDQGSGWGNGSAFLDDVAYYARHNDLRTITGTQYLSTHVVFLFGTAGQYGETLLNKTAANGGGLYFRPQDADTLKDNLTSIFDIIQNKASAAASTAITSEPISGVDLIYIPYYKHPEDDQWWGNIRAFRIGSDGSLLTGDSGTSKALDTDNDLVLDSPKWDATLLLESKAEADTRVIYTSIPGQTNPYLFNTSNASIIGKYFDVNLDADSAQDEVGTDQEVNALISYIRGNDNPSTRFTLRPRKDNYLGDIMHANPVFVGVPGARFDLIYGDMSYWDFYWTGAVQNRKQVLYTAANDGMLHCFDASNGEELWAYIPYNLLPHLKWLSDPNCCHSYYVDLSSNVWDIRFSTGEWKSVLVGGMRIGGTPAPTDTNDNGAVQPPEPTLRSAMFALDVTDPDPGDVEFLWENNDERFGYTTSKPIAVRVGPKDQIGNWYVIFGSGPRTRAGEGASTSDGYTTTYNNGYIFIVNPETGAVVRDINLGAGNFFGSPVAIDYDLDYSVDMIYIGDAKGNLWRIKTFTGPDSLPLGKTYQTDPAQWIIDVAGSDPAASNPQPLLSLGTDQPILIKPAIGMDEDGRVWIHFGTGRHYCANDNDCCGSGINCPPALVPPVSGSCPSGNECSKTEVIDGTNQTRSLYMAVGVYDRYWDNTNKKFVLQSATIGASGLDLSLDHRVIKQGTIVGSGEAGYFVVDYTTGEIATDVSDTKDGWYFRLLENKERSLGDYVAYGGTVFFISFKPDTTGPCTNNGGLSNLYGVNYTSGTSTYESFFDLTGEGDINGDDKVRGADNQGRGAAIKRLDKGYAGGGIKIKTFTLPDGTIIEMGYTPLPEEGMPIDPSGKEYDTGITTWREVLQ